MSVYTYLSIAKNSFFEVSILYTRKYFVVENYILFHPVQSRYLINTSITYTSTNK